jgi:predicted PhzF superfamily epimerase YddE/YHI9
MPSGNLTISQGEEIRRPSTLHVEVRPEGDALAVWVAGGVRVVGDGAFTVPD